MIIVDRYKENERTFGEANPGDCFIKDGDYYIKTNDPECNAVDLRTGEIVGFVDEAIVEAIRMKAEVY